MSNIDNDLLNDREFLNRILIPELELGCQFDLPNKFCSDIEIIKKYLLANGNFNGINIEILNLLEKENYIDSIFSPKEIFLDYLADKIEEMGTIVVNDSNDLDIKFAIEALQKWAEDNDLIRIGYPLKLIKSSKGKIKEGYVNLGIGIDKGSNFNKENSTVIIDKDQQYGIKSLCEALVRLNIYVPEEVIEQINLIQRQYNAKDIAITGLDSCCEICDKEDEKIHDDIKFIKAEKNKEGDDRVD